MTRWCALFALETVAVTVGILATIHVGLRVEEHRAAQRQARKRGMAMHPAGRGRQP